MSRILPLSEEAASQIYSSKHILNLQGVVLSLLENSLDASANKVEIAVDFPRGGCTVEDNGVGILPSEFEEQGGLGKLYHTSKHAANGAVAELHGSSGTFIASLGALCLLSIISRYKNERVTASLVMHNGRVITRSNPASAYNDLNLSSGTRVTVRDLFGNMPVRVKHRSIASGSTPDDEKVWEELKHGIAALLLAWCRPCSVRLRESRQNGRTATFSGSHSAFNSLLTEKILNSLDGRPAKYELRDALSVLHHAGLIPIEMRQRFVPVSASTSRMAVNGMICLDPAPTKQCQFISMGVHPYHHASGHNELYEAVNRIFTNSSFGAVEDDIKVDEAEKDRRKRDRRYKNDSYTQKQIQSKKGVDRWPRFVLQMRATDQISKITRRTVNSDFRMKAIIDILTATVAQWLQVHHFRPRKPCQSKSVKQDRPTGLSSSPQKSSTADGLTGRCGEFLPTPPMKRAATATDASTLKKRRIFDRSEARLGRNSDLTRGPSSYFDGLSRVKSGRPDTGSKCLTSHETSDKVISLVASNNTTPGSDLHPFRLPILSRGALSAKVTSGVEPDASLRSAPMPHEQNAITIRQNSDDYGSVDDEASIDAADAVEDYQIARPATRNDRHQADLTADENVITYDPIVEWFDPKAKQMYHVNTRTGVVLPIRAASKLASTNVLSRQKEAVDTFVSIDDNPPSFACRSIAKPATSHPQWLPGFLKQWNNPVYNRQDEQRIPLASADGPGMQFSAVSHDHYTEHDLTQHFSESCLGASSKLSKQALSSARVIRQVDAKFILCSVKSSEGGEKSLVLVDQHAASERVILERLLDELCIPTDPISPLASFTSNIGCKSAVQTKLLEKPQRFQISKQEHDLFFQHSTRFADWGILYDLISTAVSGESQRQDIKRHIISVTTLPPGIAERCIFFPNLLIEMLRREIWDAHSRGKQGRRAKYKAGEADAHSSWLARIGGCPKGIMELLNSRACRSAVMFNDILSVVECERLLAQLGDCAFPFMCAHGRVSMVPLAQLGHNAELAVNDFAADGFGLELNVLRGSTSRNRQCFSEVFTRWRSRTTNIQERVDC